MVINFNSLYEDIFCIYDFHLVPQIDEHHSGLHDRGSSIISLAMVRTACEVTSFNTIIIIFFR